MTTTVMRKRPSGLPIGLTAAAACVALGGVSVPPAAAYPARVEMLKPITGASPFPNGCGSQGEFTRGSEGGNRLAVNPSDAQNLITFYAQDPRAQGSAQLNVARVTRDGGRTWRQVIPHGSKCVEGTADRQFGPWVTFDALSALVVLDISPQPDGRLGVGHESGAVGV